MRGSIANITGVLKALAKVSLVNFFDFTCRRSLDIFIRMIINENLVYIIKL